MQLKMWTLNEVVGLTIRHVVSAWYVTRWMQNRRVSKEKVQFGDYVHTLPVSDEDREGERINDANDNAHFRRGIYQSEMYSLL